MNTIYYFIKLRLTGWFVQCGPRKEGPFITQNEALEYARADAALDRKLGYLAQIFITGLNGMFQEVDATKNDSTSRRW